MTALSLIVGLAAVVLAVLYSLEREQREAAEAMAENVSRQLSDAVRTIDSLAGENDRLETAITSSINVQGFCAPERLSVELGRLRPGQRGTLEFADRPEISGLNGEPFRAVGIAVQRMRNTADEATPLG
jgi:hypothetical protein